MLKVVSTKYVNDEKLEEFLKIANKMVNNTQVEKGCLSYSMNKDTKEKDRYAFLEEWENEEFLKMHLATDFMKENVPLINGCCYKKGELMIFEKLL